MSPPKFTLKRKLHTEKKSNQTLNNQYDRYSALFFFSSDSTFLVCTSFFKEWWKNNNIRYSLNADLWNNRNLPFLSPFKGCFDEFFVYVKKHPCNYYLYEIKNMDKNTRGNKKKTKSNTKNVLSVFILVFLFIFSLPIRRSMFTYNKYVDHVELGFWWWLSYCPALKFVPTLKRFIGNTLDNFFI